MSSASGANVRFAQLSSAARSLWPTMSSPPPATVKYRGREKKRPTTPNPDSPAEKINEAVSHAHSEATAKIGQEWDYKLAFAVMTILAFWTRFWGITHPDQVVFDEVHFGKVSVPSFLFFFLAALGNLLTESSTVCFVLPPAHLLLRRPPSFRKASLRVCRLACRIRWCLPLRKHWRFIHCEQGSLCGLQGSAGYLGCAHGPHRLPDHVGVRI